jgi:hypothetical protein
MPSPFPGMNPFLEQNDSWVEFHNDFILRARDALIVAVGPNYLVRAEERLILHELSADERRFLGTADVGIASLLQPVPGDNVAVLDAPVTLQLPSVELEKLLWLEIRDRRSRRVVTVIELLSPSNKRPGGDLSDYAAKRRAVLAGSSHLVEIDLRRGGTRPDGPALPACDYYVLVSRVEDRPNLGFWPISLRDPLPAIPIPRDAPDPAVDLDLKAVLDHAYDAGDYGKYIYTESPDPPLSTADQVWAKAFIP